MENINTYIETGILEQYVLGELSPEEMIVVEEKAAQHSEVKNELSAIELALEKFAIANAVQPPAHIANRMISALDREQNTENIKHRPEHNIVPLKINSTNTSTLKFALAACIALLLISVAALYITYSKLNDAHDQIASLNVANQKFAANVNKLEYQNSGLTQSVELIRSKEWTTVQLAGVQNTPKAKMEVYWNKTKTDVVINYTAMDLPETDSSHQYQLWALVDGKPISLGTFGGKSTSDQVTVAMQGIENAQAFAVTIEPNGGSVSPTMEKMVVMGSV